MWCFIDTMTGEDEQAAGRILVITWAEQGVFKIITAKLKGRACVLSREIEKPWEISPRQGCPTEWGLWQIHQRQSGIFGFSEVRISQAAVKTSGKNLPFLAFPYRLTDDGAAQNLRGLFNFSGLSCYLMRGVSAGCIGHGKGEGPSRCGLSSCGPLWPPA